MRRNVKRPGVKLKAVCVLLLVIALLFGMYCAGRWLEKRMANPEPDGDYRQHITDNTGISYGRKTYRLKRILHLYCCWALTTAMPKRVTAQTEEGRSLCSYW